MGKEIEEEKSDDSVVNEQLSELDMKILEEVGGNPQGESEDYVDSGSGAETKQIVPSKMAPKMAGGLKFLSDFAAPRWGEHWLMDEDELASGGEACGKIWDMYLPDVKPGPWSAFFVWVGFVIVPRVMVSKEVARLQAQVDDFQKDGEKEKTVDSNADVAGFVQDGQETKH